MENEKVVVGIDFGTSGIGYAFDFSGCTTQSIILSDLPGQKSDHKVPSEIILDNYMEEVLAFGAQCKDYIMTHKKNEYEYFKNIKMNLYKNNYTIKSTNGKEVKVETIITKILKKISEEALSQIQKGNKDIQKKDIKWIVTIPAIWEQKSKQIMIDASINAGLIDKDSDKSLFLALEPEVASIYYLMNSLMGHNFKSSEINDGKPYIICDIGAGTVDICTHRRNITNSKNKKSEVYEEYPPVGTDGGGYKINEEFIKRLIVEIFGEEKVKNLQTNSFDNEDWDKFEKEIEDKKIACCVNKTDKLTIDCALFDDESNKKTIDDYITEYNKKNLKYKIKKKKRWEIEFPSQIFYDIINEISNEIFLKIEEIYKNVKTGLILFTGAGSKNNLIKENLYKLAKEYNIDIKIETPPTPEISIMKGSVLFGFQNDIIRFRKAKYTIGIRNCNKWEDKYEGKGEKLNDSQGNRILCSNLFSKFITRNQYIEFNSVFTKLYDSIVPNPKIIFFKTDKEDCTFINEKDNNGDLIIHEFGRVQFNIDIDYDKNNRDVLVEMRFGGTYIDVNVIYKKTKKNLKVIKSFY